MAGPVRDRHGGGATLIRRAAPVALLLALLVLAPVGPNAGGGDVRASTQQKPSVPSLRWAATWAAADQRLDGGAPWTRVRLPRPELADTTVRLIVRTTAGGSAIRLRLTNIGGLSPVVLNHVTAAMRGSRAAVVWGTVVDAKFGGLGHVTLVPGAVVYSDPILLPTTPGADLAISMHVVSARPPFSGHWAGKRSSFLTAPRAGDQTWGLTDAGYDHVITSTLWLSAVETFADPKLPVVVAIGDSLTDGHFSTNDRDQDWPAVLSARLSGKAAVINAGVNANTVTLTRCGQCGEPVLSRLDRDALDVAGASHLILLAGTNDVSLGVPATAVADGLLEVARRARARGMKVFVGTIPPRHDTYNGWDPRAEEAQRQALNTWIRRVGKFDQVLDFDALLRDPAHPGRLAPQFDSGDHVHPSPAGWAVMANAIDTTSITG